MLSIAAALSGSAAAAAAGKPMHVMSLNLCTDGLILDILPPERIASVTYLSRSASNSFRSSEAARVPINYGTAEEALVEKPDLVLAGTYTTTATRAMLKNLGVAILEVPPANSFADIGAVTRRVGRALGEEQKAELLIARMEAILRELSVHKPPGVIRVSGWNGGGSIPGKGTLFDAILTAAGGVNIATSLPDTRSGSFDIEELLMARPDVLAYGADSNGTSALRTDADQHPVILRIYKNRRVKYPEVLYSCGVPEIADAAVEFRSNLLAAAQGRDQP